MSVGLTWRTPKALVIPTVPAEDPGGTSPTYAIALESWIAVRALLEGEPRRTRSRTWKRSSECEAREKASGIILNAGAYTHTSIAILDALNAAEKPVIELHLSNVFRRESFRHHSYVAPAAQGVICGFGPKGYELAVEAMADLLTNKAAR